MAEIEPGLRVITLGTAGGPRWWGSGQPILRTGIATAIAVGDVFYLVDCGHGVGRRLNEAGLGMKNLRGIFLTHLHSDHTIDLASLAVFGLYEMADRTDAPVRLLGPGDRGALPPVSPRATVPPQPVAPHCPTPGTRQMFETLIAAHATDLNDRVMDGLRPNPMELFVAEDIAIPAGSGYNPTDNPTPRMAPFEIYRDDLVTVTAVLVEHPPIAPAFAFRFDTASGSVTISGDTAPTANMVELARDTDLLLHEAIDFDFVEAMYAGRVDEGSRASRDHHYKSHTSVRDAARIATAAGARRLALHHLVPGTAPAAVWQAAADDFAGDFILPDDLDVITVQPAPAPV
nr:MBL fold metallo-hydrolase [Microbacterium bovistercoris]